MKKVCSILLCLSLGMGYIYAQVPQLIKYQAVLRDAAGNVKASESVSIDIAILHDSTNGTIIYTETHSTNTNTFGLVTLEIGSKNPAGFAAIDWAAGPYFLKISVDGTEMGTSQLLSVPYAMFATKAGNGFSGNYDDLTNKPALFSGSYSDLTDKPTLFSGNYEDLGNKPDLSKFAKADHVDSIANLLLNLPVVDFNYSILFSSDSTYFRLSADDASSNYPSISLHEWYVNGLPGIYRVDNKDTSNVPHMRYFYNANGHYTITHSITVDGKVYSKEKEFDIVGIKQ